MVKRNLFLQIFLLVLLGFCLLSHTYRVQYTPFMMKQKIQVEVRGEVREEGIYQFDRGANIRDLLQKVKVKPEADYRAYSLQQKLRNGDVIVIPRSSKELLKVSLNAAPLQELSRLPGVSENIAKRIIEYRQQHGSFRNIQEIMEVKGIGAKKFAKLMVLLTL